MSQHVSLKASTVSRIALQRPCARAHNANVDVPIQCPLCETVGKHKLTHTGHVMQGVCKLDQVSQGVIIKID